MNSKETIDPNVKLRNKVHSRTYQAISSQSRGKEGFLRPNIHIQTHTHTHTKPFCKWKTESGKSAQSLNYIAPKVN